MYSWFKKEELRKKMNKAGRSNSPFYFITDFTLNQNLFLEKDELKKTGIQFDFEGNRSASKKDFLFSSIPVSFESYAAAYDHVAKSIRRGESFLVNLTQPSQVFCELSLAEIYGLSVSKYKLLVPGYFVVFSPETFIKINDAKISTFPMKGTISAALPNAESLLLNDEKESAEHATIVDLLRNDLSKYAENVHVKRFKFIQRVSTHKGDILQMSSEINGDLSSDYHKYIGDIILSMLPAGSVTGAPKERTIKIITESEGYNRGFYCGVAGYFDGFNLDSFVLIRFIEETGNHGRYIYKSGGGITHLSDPEQEYRELVEKVYVAVR